MAEKNNPTKDLTVIVRQEKDNPDGWNIAMQTGNPVAAAEHAKTLARSENNAFGVQAGGDIVGNNVNYYLMTKGDLAKGFEPEE